jgi:hypothetical protein
VFVRNMSDDHFEKCPGLGRPDSGSFEEDSERIGEAFPDIAAWGDALDAVEWNVSSRAAMSAQCGLMSTQRRGSLRTSPEAEPARAVTRSGGVVAGVVEPLTSGLADDQHAQFVGGFRL